MAAEPLGRLAEALEAAAVELAKLGHRWALVGGLAVSARSEPRFTRDIDIAVAVSGDDESEAVVNSLLGRGYRLLASLEQEQSGRLAAVRLQCPGQSETGIVIDLLFASSGIEPELVNAADEIEVFRNLSWPVARLGHLLAIKVLSRSESRPQDSADIVSLLAQSDEAALQLAREAARLIDARGYGRGRSIEDDLDQLIETHVGDAAS